MDIIHAMEKVKLKQFSERLIEALLDSGEASSRQSKTGVTTKNLREIAGVTNEMARRYTLGQAWPDPEKMAKIALWLNVREAWLRFGEEPKTRQAADGSSSELQLSVVPPRQSSRIDQSLLRGVISAVESSLSRRGVSMDVGARASLISGVYAGCIEAGRSGDAIPPELITTAIEAITSQSGDQG